MELILETARLALRDFQSSDRDQMARLANNFAITKMTSTMPFPYTREDADEFLNLKVPYFHSKGDLVFAIVLKDDPDTYMGTIGLHFKDDEDHPELGYWIGEPFWGKGYVSELTKAFCAYAFETLDIDAMTAGYFADNPASGRVLDKLGFHYVRRRDYPSVARGEEADGHLLELTRDAWMAKQNG